MSSTNKIPLDIPKWAQHFISSDDCTHITQAINKAESKTKGEIVPMIVRSSASAHMLPWTATLILLVALLILEDTLRNFVGATTVEWLLPAVAVVGYLIFRTSWARVHLHRFFLHPIDRHAQVLARAELEFHRSRIDKTPEHSSILIMASLLERDVVVFADSGVVARVPQETWNEVVNLLISGIKSDQVADGWIRAIGRAGEILAEHYSAPNHANNEIANEIIIKE